MLRFCSGCGGGLGRGRRFFGVVEQRKYVDVAGCLCFYILFLVYEPIAIWRCALVSLRFL